MADPINCLAIDTPGFLSDELRSTRHVSLFDTLRAADALSSTVKARLYTVAATSDTAVYALRADVFEHGRLADSIALRQYGAAVVAEAGRVRDALRSARHASTLETGRLADATRGHSAAKAADVGRLAESWRCMRHAKGVVRESGALSDALRIDSSVKAQDTAHGSDALRVRRRVHALDTALAAESWRIARGSGVRVTDSAVVDDALALRRHAVGRVFDEAFALDRVALPGAGVAWTANTDAWGASRYTGQPFNSLAVVDGVLMAAGPEGVYRLDADADDAAPIAAWIDTGYASTKSRAVSRVGSLYVGATSNGTLQARAASAERGNAAASFAYRFEPRTGADYAPSRCKFGRGQQSRYWGFRVENVDGADFTIDSMSALFEPGSRRV